MQSGGSDPTLGSRLTKGGAHAISWACNQLGMQSTYQRRRAADAAALVALTTAFTTVTSGNLLVAYAAADNGDARIALVTLTAGDITAAVDLAILVGIDVDNVAVGMFTLA